jgi:cysteine desulfurase / selenocysteine lyase
LVRHKLCILFFIVLEAQASVNSTLVYFCSKIQNMKTMQDLDIGALRAETPGCKRVVHFNNAGAALMPQPVLNAVMEHLQLEADRGGYEAARHAEGKIHQVYDSVATLLGARPNEIAILQNATRAWQQVFYAIPFQPGDIILTSMAEYASNYIAYLQVAQKTGARVEAIPNDESGQLSVEALKNRLDDRVKLIAVTHIPTNGGLVNPAEAIGRIAREAGVLYLLDACQSAGQLPLDVESIGCDFLSATGRKYLRGPRGTGFLYVRQERIAQLEPPMLDLHAAEWVAPDRYRIRDDARRFENWEASYASNIGLGVAVDYALNLGLETIWQRIQFLAGLLRQELNRFPRVKVRDLGEERCGIVSFTVDGLKPEAVVAHMAVQQININSSPPQYTLLDMRDRHLNEGVVRASVHYYNTEDDIDRLIAALQTLI